MSRWFGGIVLVATFIWLIFFTPKEGTVIDALIMMGLIFFSILAIFGAFETE